eukprot:TRINITY_DN31866_c0_g1_i1.p1 TRINITY_DN31866_c0_g1~~TRINITY_DN31866_c0_g1_i1.p1  ORF type:complete len:1542 (-),score=265.91 TRINITY_DN31866_c0_g1_i1:71-4588(-)
MVLEITKTDLRDFADLLRKAGTEVSEAQLISLFGGADGGSARGVPTKVRFGDLRGLIDHQKDSTGTTPVIGDPAAAAAWENVRKRAEEVFGKEQAEKALSLLRDVVKDHLRKPRVVGAHRQGLGPRDAALITYANTFGDDGGLRMPLQCLSTFLARYDICKTMKTVHILPMYPWDTDRGFSIMDYYKVDPTYGDWTDIEDMMKPVCGCPHLMFDFVCNHASIKNPVVQGGLLQRHLKKSHCWYTRVQRFKDFVIAYAEDHAQPEQCRPPDEELAKLVRPRAHPVLTPYFIALFESGGCKAVLGTPEKDAPLQTVGILGRGYVWTTFSRGKDETGQEQTRQVDLNFRNPAVLAEVLRVLLFYVRQGSNVIRLDAIGYIWKVLGSASIHERGCHALLEIVTAVLQVAAPEVFTIAEVNEPQSKCLSYLGGSEVAECDMVYQFAAFPLAIHAQISENISYFAKWLLSMKAFKGRQFVTVLGSHDGLSQKQARELLPPMELERLQDVLIRERGGKPNYAVDSGGNKIVYEICGTPWCLVNGDSTWVGSDQERRHEEDMKVQLGRYVSVLCMGLLARGMPGIYVTGLLGTENFIPKAGLDENRTLNRERFDISNLFETIDDPSSRVGLTFHAVQRVLRVRMHLPQFDRSAPPPVVLRTNDKAILAVVLCPQPEELVPPVLVLINVTGTAKKAVLNGLPAPLLGCRLVDALEGAGSLACDEEPRSFAVTPLTQEWSPACSVSWTHSLASEEDLDFLYRTKSRRSTGFNDAESVCSLDWEPDLCMSLGAYQVLWLTRPTPIAEPAALAAGLSATPETSVAWEPVARRVIEIYGEDECSYTIQRLRDVVAEHLATYVKENVESASCRPGDSALITYADSIVDDTGARKPLGCLGEFLSKHDICSSLPAVHILPMYPWDTDRGFSITDYYQVDPRYGDWNDVRKLHAVSGHGPKLMLDIVCNHASIANPIVQGALLQRHLPEGHPRYKEVQRYENFVIAYGDGDGVGARPPDDVLRGLTRPREHSVLTPYFVVELAVVGGSAGSGGHGRCEAVLGTPESKGTTVEHAQRILGRGYVWTTFSRGQDDRGQELTRQVDLNFRNPAVLAEVVRVVLFYIRQGAVLIRLDSIGYIWKVLGSTSIHERGCHVMLEILCDVLQIAAPSVLTVAEVNEPQDKCFEYLGRQGVKEGDMVYQFTAFPMAIHAEISQDASYFGRWLGTMNAFKGRQFVTVLGSHDGLPQKQARKLLPPEELENLQQALIHDRGCKANYAFSHGVKIVYEVCGTPWSLINGAMARDECLELQVARYVMVLSLGLLARGMPGIYINGLLGANNYEPPHGLDEFRTLNRESFDLSRLEILLNGEATRESTVFHAVLAVMEARAALPQFDRDAPPPAVLEQTDPAVLGVILRPSKDAVTPIPPMLAVVNVANEARTAALRGLPSQLMGCELHDALGGAGGRSKLAPVCAAAGRSKRLQRSKSCSLGQGGTGSAQLTWTPEVTIALAPYEVQWLVPATA